MLTFIVLLGLGIVFGVKKAAKEEGEKDRRVDYGLVGGTVGIFAAMFMAMIMTIIIKWGTGTLWYQQYEKNEKTEIIALRNFAGIKGDFFVGSGQIRSAPYYFFYYKTTDGGKKLRTIEAETTTIYEEKRSDGYIMKVVKKETYKPDRWVLLIPKFLLPPEQSHLSGYVIHIPEGSVKQGFDLDLKNL